MEKLTFEQISEIIKKYDLFQYLFNQDEDEYLLEDKFEENELNGLTGKEFLKSLNFDNYEQVDYVCNTDEMFTIIYFKDSDIYIKLTGEYDSYGQYNHEYDDEIEQVFPKQITKTIYE
jgi:hypothetical protein